MTSRMIKSKREYKCSACGKTHIKWEGRCRYCKAVATLVEVQLIALKPTATQTQKSLQRRSKTSERTIAKRMVAADGPDPAFEKIATSTGRIGHITNIRVDAISAHYVTENKNRLLPGWLMDAWLLINQRAEDFGKNCLLHLDPPNMPKDYAINGQRKKLSTMAVITQDRHEQLIKSENLLTEVMHALGNTRPDSDVARVRAIRSLLTGE